MPGKENARSMNKLILAVICLVAVYAVIVFIYAKNFNPVASMNLAFYLLLLFNTYFSICFTEAAYHLRIRSDDAINVPLVASYLFFPWLLSCPQWYYLVLAVFFTLAMMKYANWLAHIKSTFFLRRKILANGLASVLAAIASVIITARPHWSTWVVASGTLIFAYANVHTLILDPLYRDRT